LIDRGYDPAKGDEGVLYRYNGPTASIDLASADYKTSDWTVVSGKTGSVYRYMGPDASLTLGTQNYTDLRYWQQIPESQILPEGISVAENNSIAVGGTVVLNSVHGGADAHIQSAKTVSASLAVEAAENALIRAK